MAATITIAPSPNTHMGAPTGPYIIRSLGSLDRSMK